MLPFISNIAVPSLVFFLMLIVGLDLKNSDFRRVAQYPRTVVIAIVGQSAMLPALAAGIIMVHKPPAPIAAAMLFLALSPGGALSNFYTQLAGQNVALSITLTAVNTLTALVTIPLFAGPLIAWTDLSGEAGTVPASRVLAQLGLFVIAPAAIGMWIGRGYAEAIGPWRNRMRNASFFMLAVLLLLSTYEVRDTLAASFTDILSAAALFVAGAMLVGVLVAAAVPVADRPVVVVESAVRNIPVAILIGSELATDASFAGFLACYLLVEIPVLVAYAAWARRSRVVLT